MRTTAFTSLLVLGALGATAHADHDATPATKVAVTVPGGPARSARSLASGRIGLTGSLLATPRAPSLAPGESSHLVASPPRKKAFVAAGDVTAAVTPYALEIERCYLDRAGSSPRGGHLDVTFVIAREGRLLTLRAASPGVPTRTAQQIEGCIRAAVETLQFPSRRNDTTAIVPYLFQRTEAPNAGPQLSCWNPRGCRTSPE